MHYVTYAGLCAIVLVYFSHGPITLAGVPFFLWGEYGDISHVWFSFYQLWLELNPGNPTSDLASSLRHKQAAVGGFLWSEDLEDPRSEDLFKAYFSK